MRSAARRLVVIAVAAFVAVMIFGVGFHAGALSRRGRPKRIKVDMRSVATANAVPPATAGVAAPEPGAVPAPASAPH